jgi:hypothetical protein
MRTLTLLAIACLAVPALAEEPDKRQFHLFNPTPREWMRPLSTDRPDLTESPFTVDAGHFQIEMDVLNYGYDRYTPARDDVRVESLAIAPFNLKLGLLNNADLQIVIPTYNRVRIHDRAAGTVENQRGFGDLVLRSKINLWGNDSGTTAMAIMPVLKLPTNQDGLGNNSVEGGLIIPFAMDLPHGWGLGAMAEVGLMRDAVDSGYHPEFINTVALGREIVGNLSGYVEFFSLLSADSGAPWIGAAGVGFTYGLSPDIQLDGGINFGLTRAAEDINPFFGISWRF